MLDFIKGGVVFIVACISSKLGILMPIMVALCICMLVDYVTGVYSGFVTGEVSSKKGLRGIIKKLCYIICVGVAVMIDWLIINVSGIMNMPQSTGCYFGIITAVWLIFNEMISILENISRIGVPLPKFLLKLVLRLKSTIEENE